MSHLTASAEPPPMNPSASKPQIPSIHITPPVFLNEWPSDQTNVESPVTMTPLQENPAKQLAYATSWTGLQMPSPASIPSPSIHSFADLPNLRHDSLPGRGSSTSSKLDPHTSMPGEPRFDGHSQSSYPESGVRLRRVPTNFPDSNFPVSEQLDKSKQFPSADSNSQVGADEEQKSPSSDAVIEIITDPALRLADFWGVEKDDKLTEIATNDPISAQDLDRCWELHEKRKWVIARKTRDELYTTLFGPLEPRVTIDHVVSSKIEAVRNIQHYWLFVLRECKTQWGFTPLPPLKAFVRDINLVIVQLKERRKLPEVRHSADPVEGLSFDLRFQWFEKWIKYSNIQSLPPTFDLRVLRHYCCGLLDVLFGIWPAPGRCIFHRDVTLAQSKWSLPSQLAPNCIQSSFYFWEKETVAAGDYKTKDSISLDLLDASAIESRGPYRFVKTDRIEEHLTVSHRRIRIFVDWERLLMLSHHTVFSDADEIVPEDQISGFQLLTTSRWTQLTSLHESRQMRFISYELLRTYVLLFFRRLGPRDERSTESVWWKRIGNFAGRYFDRTVAQRVGLDFGQDEEYLKGVLQWYAEGGELRAESDQFTIFRGRLEALAKELKAWKPGRLLELSYHGYGSVDPVTLYAFYFAIGFGIMSIATLFFTIVPLGVSWQSI